MFDLIDEAAQSARAKFVHVVAEVVLVDALAQSDRLVETVNFHRPAPGCGPAKHLCHLVGPRVQVVRPTVVEGSRHAIATRSDSASDTGADIGVTQQLSRSLGRYGGAES